MRRRERLTGFLIIFILLTFSAYSNSINVGGGAGRINNQPTEIKENSQTKKNVNFSQSLTNKDKNIGTMVNKKLKSDLDIEDKTKAETAEFQITAESAESKNIKTNIKKINGDLKNHNIPEKSYQKRPEPKLIEQIKVHKVKSGETLWDIAHKHELNIDTLIGANNISNMNSIKPGQEFKILPVKGIIYRVSPGESVGSIARKFGLSKETIMKDNNIKDPSKLKIDQNLILRGAKPEFSYQDRLDQKFMYPINTRITSYYGPRWGRMHEGIDFAAPMGSPIRAVSSGRVVYSGWATGYGYVVIVEHQRGLRTLYAHNSKLLVREGESVGKGEVISRSGNTGNSTGPHLHFEVQVNGRPENPLEYINK